MEELKKKLDHVPINEFETLGKAILEEAGYFHDEYKEAFEIMTNTDPPWSSYLNSLTGDLFSMVVTLRQIAVRDSEKAKDLVDYIIAIVEEAEAG